jgi:hypothetical protein
VSSRIISAINALSTFRLQIFVRLFRFALHLRNSFLATTTRLQDRLQILVKGVRARAIEFLGEDKDDTGAFQLTQ